MKGKDCYICENLIQDDMQFTMPIYQRKYEWEIADCEKLFFDIEKLVKRKSKHYYIGNITGLEDNDSTPDMTYIHIIDGQQRLITISLMILALHNTHKDIIIEDLLNDYLLNEDQEGSKYYKLSLLEEDNYNYISLINNSEKINKESPIYNNYEYFHQKFKTMNKDEVIHFFNEGIKKLLCVYMSLDKERDNPQMIFENVNSTNLDLSNIDLMRNFVLMNHDDDIKNHLYYDIWNVMEKKLDKHFEEFLISYFKIKSKRKITSKFLYDEVQRYIFNYLDTDSESIQDLLYDIFDYHEFFYNLYNPEKEEKENVKSIIKELKMIFPSKLNPITLLLYKDYKNSIISANKFIELSNIITSYVFKQFIIKNNTAIIDDFVIKYLNEYSYHNHESVLNNIFKHNTKHKMPTNKVVIHEIKNIDLYNNRLCKFILSKIESSLLIGNIEDLSIEHIMPKKLTDSWEQTLGENFEYIYDKYLNNIGNLTLTCHNSEMSNKSFIEKKHFLYNTKPVLFLNSQLKDINKWGEDEVIKRQQWMSNNINNVLIDI